MKKYFVNWEYIDENGIGMNMKYGGVSGDFTTLAQGKDCIRKLNSLTAGKLKYRL